MARRTVAVAAVIVVAALAGVSYAASSVDSDDWQPASFEIDSFAADAGIPKSVARRKLGEQRKLGALEAAAHDALGAEYGGIWVDGHQQIKLALVDGTPDTSAQQAQAVIEQVALEGAVDIVRVPRSEDELTGLQHRMESELVAVNRGTVDTIDVEPDIVHGFLIVLRPKRMSSATNRQRRYLATVKDRYGAVIRIRTGPGPGSDLMP